MEELKKCPFCGGKAVFNTISNSSSHHGVGFDFEIRKDLLENGDFEPVK